MRLVIRFAAKLYPRSWRERYGAEFDALLDDIGADPHRTECLRGSHRHAGSVL